MQNNNSCFTRFTTSTKQYSLPKRFTFPFYYQPHPLCVLAAEQLQQQLKSTTNWQHNFGLTDDPKNVIGKMFGVLLVQNSEGELGYIAAFSGKLAEQSQIQGFVPPVFDLLAEDSFFFAEKNAINRLNSKIQELENAPELLQLTQQMAAFESGQNQQLQELRQETIENRKKRKLQRQYLKHEVDQDLLNECLKALAKQSVTDKWRLKELTEHQHQAKQKQQAALHQLIAQITDLKRQRKQQSAELQNKIFAQYQFLNRDLEVKTLLDIFAETAFKTPPAGAGECAAPKLLQYAFTHGLKPLAMAEFWWGASPKSEIKKHQQYYPACSGKCQPILKHMLKGMALDENPLTSDSGKHKELDIVYKDPDILIVNKPAEFLSVPGKEISDSVFQRIKQQFPEATGPLIVHRLDMSTSGLMVIALNSAANKSLQKQFIRREVHKQYVALITGLPKQDSGEITLPLRGDIYDRPKQLVCHNSGKQALTKWQVLERNSDQNQTRLLLTPHTGRTHQLRVHCAHAEGLNMPILGDDLYGRLDNRLYLHAQRLEITHPVNKKNMVFQVEASF
ncbi:RluA family pseudouridine synthase [uncultured Paraglaciecola sp.]|uniref:RluA family pseudouridine synthase n=1 Tax=uncultured Paraglaciecola sp. TaxID=1765024 RepID=UPI00261419A1|nr:RluA family pseudouridine synthase [uncultured Paraglaciecola sp.]